MKLLANENFPLVSVHALRNSGMDIISISEDSPGIADEEVMVRAEQEQRVILTFDRDYGELIYKMNLSKPAGIVYFRFMPTSPIEPAEYVMQLLSKKIIVQNKFTVVERDRIRQRIMQYCET